MDNKLYDIVKLTALKYGLNHKLTIHAAKIISPYLSIDKKSEIENILAISHDINADELLSLIEPKRFDFLKQKIDQVEVDNEK